VSQHQPATDAFLDLHESIMTMLPKLKEFKTRKQTLEKELAMYLWKRRSILSMRAVLGFKLTTHGTQTHRLRPSGTVDKKAEKDGAPVFALAIRLGMPLGVLRARETVATKKWQSG
jgi:hypothetical protein